MLHFVDQVYNLSRQCACPTTVLCNNRSEAKDILGDDWIQRHRRIVLQNANHYKRVTWTNVSASMQSSLIDLLYFSSILLHRITFSKYTALESEIVEFFPD